MDKIKHFLGKKFEYYHVKNKYISISGVIFISKIYF